MRRSTDEIRQLGGEVTVRSWHKSRNYSTSSEARAGLEALVDAGLNNPAGFHDQDVIGINNGRQPVCDDKAGVMCGGFAQGNKNSLFRV